MKRTFITSLSIVILALTGYFLFGSYINVKKEKHWNYQPSDWFYTQRAFPEKNIPFEKYFDAINIKRQILSKSNFEETWEQIGPANIGGRITALVVNKKVNRIIVGAAAGGILISSDGGENWKCTTDDFPGLSIGALKADPNNPNLIYCGTGEANSSGDSYPGFGMLKSTDGGLSWINIGLQETQHIAEIEIHPLNSEVLYVAATGPLHSKDNNRGIYKSTNGGLTWEQVLFLSDSTSAIDVAIDPTNINVVYAAMWERLRSPTLRKFSGHTSGVYKSTNGGVSWKLLSNRLPEASKYIGRISIAVAPSNPSYIYALYKNSTEKYMSSNFFGGFYKSTNAGDSWNKMPDVKLSTEFSDFGWYFGLIEVDPKDYNKVYLGEIDLLKTTDGGNNWTNITNSYAGTFDKQHPDQHALWIDSENSNYLVAGNDGGVFISLNGGSTWTKAYNLPITQFYASTIDYLNPVKKIGGTQDNGTVTSFTGKNDEWKMIYGGDGFYCLVDYSNSNIVYAESQYGGLVKSTDGGKTFYLGALYGIDYSDRRNWSTPVAMDPVDPKILYYGTYKLYRTEDGAENWTAVSGDLTRGQNGRMGTITCISANRLEDNSQIVYVGTDDCKMWVGISPEFNWIDITGNLPLRYITDVCCDPGNPDYVYVTLSGFNRDLSNAHIFKSTNRGNNWIDISGNLPDVPLNSVITNPDDNNILFVGGDAGAFYTTNSGIDWQVLGSGLPNSPVFDLNYHQPTKRLIAATHGRSLFEIDLSGLTNILHNKSKLISFQLKQNYPNPFNPETVISWKQPVTGNIILTLYNSNGEKIGDLLNKNFEAGEHSFTLNLSGRFSSLPSGVYIYRLQADKYVESKKMLLLK